MHKIAFIVLLAIAACRAFVYGPYGHPNGGYSSAAAAAAAAGANGIGMRPYGGTWSAADAAAAAAAASGSAAHGPHYGAGLRHYRFPHGYGYY